jgi:RNA polymerase sigma-70 factor (ECF subfamily)
VETLLAEPVGVTSDGVSTITPDLSDDVLESHRRELTAYCYRMLGSGSEAEDAVQETLIRAWRKADSFEGRSSVRSWLYRIATNVCLDMHRGVQRRARPMELGPSSAPDESNLGPLLPENLWVSPIADERIVPEHADPAEVAEVRDSVRLAFVTALQHLPGRQRAALILCEVLRWQATEVAELLDTSVAAVNSALQRARATLASVPAAAAAKPTTMGADDAELLAKYCDAFERYDISQLVTLLHDDAIQSMPPFAMWMQGAESIAAWMVLPGPLACKGSRMVPTMANGRPAFAQYRRNPAGDGHHAWAIQIIDISGDKISAINTFLDVENIFPSFGLPLALAA